MFIYSRGDTSELREVKEKANNRLFLYLKDYFSWLHEVGVIRACRDTNFRLEVRDEKKDCKLQIVNCISERRHQLSFDSSSSAVIRAWFDSNRLIALFFLSRVWQRLTFTCRRIWKPPFHVEWRIYKFSLSLSRSLSDKGTEYETNSFKLQIATQHGGPTDRCTERLDLETFEINRERLAECVVRFRLVFE